MERAHLVSQNIHAAGIAKGKKIYIEFEAVRQVAEVYLNGHLLGVCKNGFVPFGFDLTPYVNFGATNVLAVMCDNRFMKSRVAEAGGRWYEQHPTGSRWRDDRVGSKSKCHHS